MKNKKFIFLWLLSLCVTGCFGEEQKSSNQSANKNDYINSIKSDTTLSSVSTSLIREEDRGEYSEINPDECHYLVFYVNLAEYARILVIETDTYMSLEPFFPTIPTKEGYIGYWSEVEEVYNETELEIRIDAYYYKA